jgi:beta-phosphoglucomutase
LKDTKAIIFDLDGVLVHTNHLHRDALATAVYDCIGIDMTTMPQLYEISMMSTIEKIDILKKLYSFDYIVEQHILQKKDSLYLEKVSHLTIDDNVIETLEYIQSMKIRMAIASNSRLKNINQILMATGIMKFFDVIVSAEEVENRKPAPDILFEVYHRLGIDGRNTLFIEDTEEGVEAGLRSLSTVIQINNPSDLKISLLDNWINNV